MKNKEKAFNLCGWYINKFYGNSSITVYMLGVLKKRYLYNYMSYIGISLHHDTNNCKENKWYLILSLYGNKFKINLINSK